MNWINPPYDTIDGRNHSGALSANPLDDQNFNEKFIQHKTTRDKNKKKNTHDNKKVNNDKKQDNKTENGNKNKADNTKKNNTADKPATTENESKAVKGKCM